ncbi:hypothetical protein AQS8620_02293 [Aquimixticola soesokkakensis]|uniref:DUF1285 domain-containing protein n=1 Tax=Aquimixticola soesokkakensis TaxID=1519096 RepID=A0A1Y5T4X4_9RHOB|nr:DUF1285 domain-containing protein [Aquimixticola soesokkakensis]SLN52381.1 hypothetical protein AQS8620_02293 [Aquimixticola soesokkakensis]
MTVSPSDIADSLRAAKTQSDAGRGLPPVHLWNPPFCGDLDMEIARDGTWRYLGSPFTRPELVRLFSTILKREGDAYFLVTPAEKVGIRVVDVPFLAIDIEASGQGRDQTLRFLTSVGDHALAGPKHPIRVTLAEDGTPAPYVEIRAGLEARIDRKSFYRMVDLGVVQPHRGADWFGVWSGGAFFPIAPDPTSPEQAQGNSE